MKFLPEVGPEVWPEVSRKWPFLIVWVIFRVCRSQLWLKLSVSWYGVPVPRSRYLGKKLPIVDATVRRKKDDATVKQMINIEILDDTIDPAGLQRQVAMQIESIKSMIATVSENDDQYRELYIAIWTVPQCISHIKWGASSQGRRLYTAPCGIRGKWLSGRRTPLYLKTWNLLKNHFRSRSLRHKAQYRQPWSNKSSFLSLRWIKFWFFRLSKTHRCSLWRRVHYWSWLTSISSELLYEICL